MSLRSLAMDSVPDEVNDTAFGDDPYCLGGHGLGAGDRPLHQRASMSLGGMRLRSRVSQSHKRRSRQVQLVVGDVEMLVAGRGRC